MSAFTRQRRAVTASVLLLALLVAVLSLVFVPVWLHPALSDEQLRGVAEPEKRVTLQQGQAAVQNNVRTTLLQGLAGILVVMGAVATWRQVQISREGHVTDRLTRAIDQMGNEKVDVRVGGIYALERLAKDSVDDRLVIGEILAVFIKTHSPWPAGHRTHPDPHPTPVVDTTMPWLSDRAPDVRTALLVLGRHPWDPQDHRLVMRRVDLRRSNFYHGTLNNIDLSDSNLAASWAKGVRWASCRLSNADLRGTQLIEATLDGCDFTRSHLHDANLEGATLVGATLVGADLTGACLRGADLSDADLTDADLRGADLTDAVLTGATLSRVQVDGDTTWPAAFSP